MLERLVLITFLLLTGGDIASAQFQREICRTRGPAYYVDQNNKIELDTEMDESGCRYNYSSAHENMTHIRPTIFEKAVVMKDPQNGKLAQVGEFSFFYKPNKGFKGKDLFVIYLCGSSAGGSGCARLTYNATVR